MNDDDALTQIREQGYAVIPELEDRALSEAAAIPRERAREMSPRVRELLGYSIHPPFMGHVAGIHPGKLLR